MTYKLPDDLGGLSLPLPGSVGAGKGESCVIVFLHGRDSFDTRIRATISRHLWCIHECSSFGITIWSIQSMISS